MAMTFSRVVARYTAKHVLFHMGVAFIAFAAIIFVFDGLEAIRRAEGKNVGVGVIALLTALKLPSLALKTLPFAALIGGIWSYQRLSYYSELTAMRACGVSVWQFALPGALAAAATGAMVTLVIQPISAAMLSKHDKMRAQYFRNEGGAMSVASTGLWLKQQSEAGGEMFVRAKRVSPADKTLTDVMFYELDQDFAFSRRVDSASVKLEGGRWVMSGASVIPKQGSPQKDRALEFPSSVSLDDISGSFAPPESVPFWRMRDFADLLRRAGFPSSSHMLYFYTLLVAPAFLGSMVLFGSGFAMASRRSGQAGVQATLGLFAGFALYFLNDISRALGLGGKIPLAAAACSAPLFCLAGAALLLLHREDG